MRGLRAFMAGVGDRGGEVVGGGGGGPPGRRDHYLPTTSTTAPSVVADWRAINSHRPGRRSRGAALRIVLRLCELGNMIGAVLGTG